MTLPDPQNPVGAAAAPVRNERIAFASVLALAFALRTWDMAQSGWGNEYYAAAARSMTTSWHAFFFAAFDPAGFMAVDKPPLSLWLDAASVALFGFSPASVLLPHALAGTASVAVLMAIVRRGAGARSAVLAGLLLAVSPANVAADRSNLTDSLLVLVLLLAAWALLAGAQSGRRRTLWLAFALVGVAFNVKMLAACIVVPVFAAIWLMQAPRPWWPRVRDLALAGAIAAAVALPWMLAVELTPADQRPYVGSSAHNSAVDLVLGYNGLGRFGGRARASNNDTGAGAAAATSALDERTRNRIARLFVRAPAGPLRLADGQLAAQALWLLPLALAGVIAAARGRGWRRPMTPGRLAVVFWFAWLFVYAVVYSFAAGTFHFYYLGALAPAVAALAAAGVAAGWHALRETGAWRFLLPGALVATAAWQGYVQIDALGGDALPWMRWLSVGTGAMAIVAAGVALGVARRHGATRLAAAPVALAVSALLVLPVAWALSCVLAPANGVIPSADLLRFDGTVSALAARRERMNARLIAFLRANRQHERFLVATSTYQLAAPVIIGTGEAAMARGGFHGLDAALTAEQFAARVAAGEVRFATLGDVSLISRRFGVGQPDVVAWIRTHGTPVDPALWRADGPRTIQLYDLRPDRPLRVPPDDGAAPRAR